MVIKFERTDRLTDKPITAPFHDKTPKDGDSFLWYFANEGRFFLPFLVRVETLDGSLLTFKVVSTLDGKLTGTPSGQAFSVDLSDRNLAWGDPGSRESLPSTIKGAVPKDYGVLMLSEDYVDANGLRGKGGTGKWPLAGSDTDRLFAKFFPLVQAALESQLARFSPEEAEAYAKIALLSKVLFGGANP